jgi:nicotinate-nucleotide pyrophosphorylase (carboxylating)
MLKDNHISACGTIEKAVEIARKNISFVRKIEVETENLDMVKEAIKANVDIIMLDNMDLDTAREAVKIINKKAITEFSGNVSLQNIKEIAQIGVDYVSVGALTHSFKVLDLSMKNLKKIN